MIWCHNGDEAMKALKSVIFSFGNMSQNDCVTVIPEKICLNNETQRTPSKANEKRLRNTNRMHPAVCETSAKLCSMKNTTA